MPGLCRRGNRLEGWGGERGRISLIWEKKARRRGERTIKTKGKGKRETVTVIEEATYPESQRTSGPPNLDYGMGRDAEVGGKSS